VPSRRHLAAFADPLIHAALAAAVVAPLGRRAIVTAVVAGTAIDVDHPIAARSARLEAMLSMPVRPRSHSLLTAPDRPRPGGSRDRRARGGLVGNQPGRIRRSPDRF
jgi:hypothetical protein